MKCRIKEIRDILARHQIIEDEPGNVKEIRIGSTVTIRYEGENEDEEYRIVGSAESNPADGLISNESPLGSASDLQQSKRQSGYSRTELADEVCH
jgi:transcription elongation factor GreA